MARNDVINTDGGLNFDRIGGFVEQLADIVNPKKLDLTDSKSKGLDIVDVIQAKITAGYNWFIVPKNTRLNKTLTILNTFNIVFEGVGGFTPEFELNTGGIGIDIQGSSFVMFKNITISSRVTGLTSPSKMGIRYTRSTAQDSCQWNNSENLTIYMHTDTTANGGKGTIGLYNCTAESQSYRNLTAYADIPVVVTRCDIFGLAIQRSLSMKAVHFDGVTTLIASASHALILEGVSDITYDNLYMAKDIYYGTNNEEYGCLITGMPADGYENYDIVMLNYDCEEFSGGFKVVSRLRHSKIYGNQHNSTNRIISVETNQAILDSCEFDIQTTSSTTVIDLVYFDALCAGAINSKFNMFKSSYRITCNKPLVGCTVYSNVKPNIVINHSNPQSVHVVSENGLGLNQNYVNFSYNKPLSSDNSPITRGSYPGNFVFNTNAQVGAAAGWQCNGTDYFEVGQVGYRSIDHNPTNVETPLRLGEELFDWLGQKWYKSVGVNKADWRAMTV